MTLLDCGLWSKQVQTVSKFKLKTVNLVQIRLLRGFWNSSNYVAIKNLPKTGSSKRNQLQCNTKCWRD